jgi:putative ATP-dependent endonuclease of OLD family
VIITTHSSFVANKLGLKSLILLNAKKAKRIIDLSQDTQNFFIKLPGFDTLRLLLSNKMILVEGPSDELIFQAAFMKRHEGKLPIEKGIDVLSVGLSFKRFLQMAEIINKKVAVITDNDGNFDEKISKKYYPNDKEYMTVLLCIKYVAEGYALTPEITSYLNTLYKNV